jgi:DHA2 family multidrug resistance protein
MQGANEQVPARTWIAVMGVLLGAFMAVLDIQITNASLKDIQGTLSASDRRQLKLPANDN